MIRSQQQDLTWSAAWPIYPELAEYLGFNGSTTWLLDETCVPRERTLDEVITMTFNSLEKYNKEWKGLPFINRASQIISSLQS